jgi:Lon protease-like protein
MPSPDPSADDSASFESLPQVLPVFPLPGALLLPRGKLPLNIFEPRYLAMIRDVMAGNQLIGMIQPRGIAEEGSHPIPEDADLYGTGCVGRIASYSETEDGRMMISLVGVCRFDVVREVEGRSGYRRVTAEYARYVTDLDPAEAQVPGRERLLDALRAYFEREGVSADWTAVTATGDEPLVTALSMICPFGPEEKQALLEAPNIGTRTELLAALIEMAALAGIEGNTARH